MLRSILLSLFIVSCTNTEEDMRLFMSSLNETSASTPWSGDPEFTQLLPNIYRESPYNYVTAALTKVRYYDGMFYIIFFFKSAHTTQTGGTPMHIYKLNPNVDTEWQFISVIDTTPVDNPIYGGGFDIMPNGDFLMGVEVLGPTVAGFRNYRSSDKGITWTTEHLGLNQGSTGYSPVGMFSTGTSVMMGVIDAPPQIIRNATPNGDNGSWYVINMTDGNGIGGSPAEPNFIKLADGTIVAIWRRDIGVEVANPGTPLFCTSTDDGETWSDLAYCNVGNFYKTNVSLVHNKRDKTIEIIACARTLTGGGNGTTYYSITTEDDIKVGNLGTPIAIGTSGNASSDFGNQGADLSPDDGTLVLSYVDRPDYGNEEVNETQMYTYVGKRTNSGNPINLPQTP